MEEEKEKNEKKIGARITCVTAIPPRSWTASSESASSLKGKVVEEGPKKNRRAIHPFEHLFGMPLAPSSILPYFFPIPISPSRTLSSLSHPTVRPLSCPASPLVYRSTSFFSSDSRSAVFRPRSGSFHIRSEGLKPTKLRNRVTQ